MADFVFRRGAKPKEPRPSGAYFEANKQYIAPIPIPDANDEQLHAVTSLAEQLQLLHTSRRDTIETLSTRLNSSQMRPDPRKASWIWADVRDPGEWARINPEKLTGRKLTKWAQEHHEQLLAEHLAAVDERISFGQTMFATAADGQLKFFVGEECVIEVFVSDDEAKIILPQWMEKARDTFVSESVDAARFLSWLLDLRTTDNRALIEQLSAHTKTLLDLDRRIVDTERKMDDYMYDLYKLSPAEREIVESATAQRAKARLPGLWHSTN